MTNDVVLIHDSIPWHGVPCFAGTKAISVSQNFFVRPFALLAARLHLSLLSSLSLNMVRVLHWKTQEGSCHWSSSLSVSSESRCPPSMSRQLRAISRAWPDMFDLSHTVHSNQEGRGSCLTSTLKRTEV